MSTPLPALLILAALAALAARAEEPASYRIRARVEMIALPTAGALRLLPRLQNVYQGEAACRELQRLVKSGEAELLDQSTLLTTSDQRAVDESGAELRWPTEFEPPGIPGAFGNAAAAADAAGVAREPRQQSWGPVTPTSFETTTLGAGFEFEPHLQRDDTGLILHAELVAFLSTLDGFTESLGPADPHGVVGVIQQPVISRYKVQCSVSIRPGAHQLLGVFTRAKPQSQVIVFILSATATRLDTHP
jgi:hypothetical protein